MIEANPRLWGPSQLFVDARVPIFESFLWENNLIEEIFDNDFVSRDNVRYCWSEGADNLRESDLSCAWYKGGKEDFKTHHDLYLKYDIYHRTDTKHIIKKGDEINEQRIYDFFI